MSFNQYNQCPPLKRQSKENDKVPPTSTRRTFTARPCGDEENIKKLYLVLNSIVIQYLEILGFHDTLHTFVEECRDEGYSVPSVKITEKSKVDDGELRHKDTEELLQLFDDEDTNGILEKWKHILDRCQPENRETFNLNLQLRIYIFITIPHRQNYRDDEKQSKMQCLIEEIKGKNHDDVQDTDMLSLYALPFVTNPSQHPVFSKYFTIQWADNLRKNLKGFCEANCRQLPDPFETDVAKMYRLWSKATSFMKDSDMSVQQYHRPRNCDILKASSSAQLLRCDLPEESTFQFFFDGILRISDENERLKEAESGIRTVYLQKIQLCDALVTCLKELYTKDGNDSVVSWEKILETCSQGTLSQDSSLANWGYHDQGDGDTPMSSCRCRTGCSTGFNDNLRHLVAETEGSARTLSGRNCNLNRPQTYTSTMDKQSTRASVNVKGSGRDNVVETLPVPPPPDFHATVVQRSPRSLIDLMQCSPIIRDFVRASANTNEE